MKPTMEDIWQACHRLIPHTILMRKGGAALPEICRMVAEKCFVEQIPENEDTQIIREQIKAINLNGHFDYRG